MWLWGSTTVSTSFMSFEGDINTTKKIKKSQIGYTGMHMVLVAILRVRSQSYPVSFALLAIHCKSPSPVVQWTQVSALKTKLLNSWLAEKNCKHEWYKENTKRKRKNVAFSIA